MHAEAEAVDALQTTLARRITARESERVSGSVVLGFARLRVAIQQSVQRPQKQCFSICPHPHTRMIQKNRKIEKYQYRLPRYFQILDGLDSEASPVVEFSSVNVSIGDQPHGDLSNPQTKSQITM